MSRPDIVAYIEANGKKFHAEMRRIRGDSKKTGKAFAQDVALMSASLRGAGRAAGAVGVAAGTLIGVSGQVARAVADIGRQAERAGLGVEAFQELGFVAEQNRIPIDALTDGLKELNLRADEFVVTGKGPAAEAFSRLGFAADDLKERLADPNALFIEIIGRMEQLDRAAQIRIADELFGGTAGERYVELLDTGAAEIRKQIELAGDLGIVMDEDLIARAEELDQKFAIVSQTVGTKLQAAIVAAASALARFIDGFRAFEQQSNRSLQGRLDALDDRIAKAEANEARQLGDLLTLPRNLQDATLKGTTRATFLAQIRRELGEMRDERQRITGILEDRQTPEFKPPEFTPIDLELEKERSNGRGQAARQADREAEAVRALIAELEFERSLIGKTEVERARMTKLREAGGTATRKQRDRIVALVDAIEAETRALAENEERQRARGAAIEWGFGRIGDAISELTQDGADAADVIRRLAVELALAVAQAALLRQGPLAGLFGGGFNLFGPGPADPWAGLRVPSFAGGGSTPRGPRVGGIDGRGGMFALVHPDETIIDHMAQPVMPSTPVAVTYAPSYNYEGTAAELEAFRRQAEQDRRTFDSRVVDTVLRATDRRILRR